MTCRITASPMLQVRAPRTFASGDGTHSQLGDGGRTSGTLLAMGASLVEEHVGAGGRDDRFPMLGSPGLFVTWGWGLQCCWAFVPQMSPMGAEM